MTTTDFTTGISVDQSPKEVFDAINNVRGWWSEAIEGSTDKLNAEWTYHYEDVHRCTIKVTELVPGKRIAWQVLDNYFAFTKDKTEWIGNEIVFDITEEDGKTQVRLTHKGLVPEYECYDICQNAWTTYIQKSLYSLITTGKGQPNAKDNRQDDFSTILLVNQTPQELYDAINNVRGWWQGEIKGSTDKVGDEFTYQMKTFHFSRQKITELVPNKKIVWLVTESDLSFIKKPDEWTGTTIIFEISEVNNKTQLRFTHQGLLPAIECFGDCSNGWSELIHKSLFSLLTTGKGVEVF